VALGTVPAIEMVTLGQRRGIGLPGGGPKRYVTGIDRATNTVTVGDEASLFQTAQQIGDVTWADQPVRGEVMVQCSAHGTAMGACLTGDTVVWHEPQRRVAPGQSVVFYDPSNSYVLGGAIAI
jgi:tRNA-specific 2-thiouridylase